MLSIIIATYDRINDVIKSLSIMKEYETFKDIDSRFIIVFDGNVIKDSDKDLICKNNPGTKEIKVLMSKQHIGQNAARNLGINEAKKDNPELILFMDDDAVIVSNFELKKVLYLFSKYNNAGAIGLTSIIECNGKDQYYSKYKKGNDIFPVVYPCLAATIIRSNIVFYYNKFFFPEDIFYGSDEWALALRVRQAGYQVYATDKARCYHRFVQKGRSKKIRGNLQYAHAYIWALFPFKSSLLLLTSRLISIIAKPYFESSYIIEKIRGLFDGYIKGIYNKNKVDNEYLGDINWMEVLKMFKEAYYQKGNKLFSRIF
ncbi:MAG: hypothetical protein ACFWT2_11355 [Thermoanaerobacterium thermosaccharolyticum]|jgi:GT2 family glycosyltransferase